ncbi:alpha/beta hydrolase [Svornostia abyssi]|uniref:Alpha/beta hydrolase n=1 Tax=Svornostia abyssi TaxID=2898438 RepID=A0ABY5PIC4_9ACTN|nr:alpha/beta hydrolase [Parviterribacteraceae bacterium J379]
MRLRLFHHRDGARVAFRETGVGPALILLHSAGLSYREYEPIVGELQDRFRLVLPDLPLHGDSEDRPRHPYTLDWYAEVMAAFCRDVGGPRPLVAGHGAGAEILLRAVTTGQLRPGRLIVMPNRLHRAGEPDATERFVRVLARGASAPVLDRTLTHAARLGIRPERGMTLTARGNPAARDLIRHAMADVGGNANLARAWARAVRRWPRGPQLDLLEAYPRIAAPTLLLWADEDVRHPLATAEEALNLLPDAQLRVLPGTGFLIAYDDPVGVARELVAFCR